MNLKLHRSAPALLLPLMAGITILAACGDNSNASASCDSKSAAQSLNQGLAAHYAGKLEEAKSEYDRAVKCDPANKWAYYNLGVIAQAQGDLTTAQTNYRKAIVIDPSFASASYNLATIVSAQAPAQAKDLYLQVISQQPGWAAAHLNLAFVYLSLKDVPNAEAEFAKAAALDPTLLSRIPAQYRPK